MNTESVYHTQTSREREEIDPIFKEVLTFQFRQLNIPVQTQVEVSRLPRTIDAMVTLKPNVDLEQIRQQTPFPHLRIHNQIEFKGKNDRLNIWAYHLILGRTQLYVGENKIPPSQMTVTIVCARKPRKVLYDSREHVEFQRIAKGHYVSSDKLPARIIVTSELEINARNYPLL